MKVTVTTVIAALLLGCAERAPGTQIQPMALGAPADPVTLVREAQGADRGGNDLFLPSSPRLVNGAVWVLDAGNDNLVRFDSTLTSAKVVGREGEGPGEIQFAQDLVVDGDQLIVAETGNGRFSVFDTTGAFRTTVPLPKSPRFAAMVDSSLIITTDMTLTTVTGWTVGARSRYTRSCRPL